MLTKTEGGGCNSLYHMDQLVQWALRNIPQARLSRGIESADRLQLEGDSKANFFCRATAKNQREIQSNNF